MITRAVMIINESGLHARPATLVVKEAASYKSDIHFIYNDRKVNAKSIIQILALGIIKGRTVTIEADGEDEAAAIEAIVKLIETMAE